MHTILTLLLSVMTGTGGHPGDDLAPQERYAMERPTQDQVLTSGTYRVESKHTGKATVKVDMENLRWEEIDKKGEVLSRGRIEMFDGITAFFAEEVLSKKAGIVKFQFVVVSSTGREWEVSVLVSDSEIVPGTIQKL